MFAQLSSVSTLNTHPDTRPATAGFPFARVVLSALSSLTEDTAWAASALVLVATVLTMSRMDSDPDAEEVLFFGGAAIAYALIALAAVLMTVAIRRLARI